ncbi:MAG: metal ABC transporter substrate-binding protein [Anaerolineaceae bacterium]|nr:metal ABC transporter substrate-binding protein [Anaerolineaceae bacterium]
MHRFRSGILFPLVVLFLLLTPALYAQEAPLSIVASTSIAGDIIARVAGDDAEVASLIPRGLDPHSYQPTPAALRQLADADLVFINGANYEEGLLAVIGAAVDDEALFVISECVPIIPGGHMHDHHDHGHDDHADEHDHEDEDDDHADEHDHEGEDDDHADEHDHEGEDDDHADEHDHEGEDDDHADEHDHEGEDHHHDLGIHEDAGERCARHEMELGDRFQKLQDDEVSPGPLHAVDCEAIGGCDPHVWLQVRGIAHWVLSARDILSAHDSAHAEGYHARADSFLDEIEALEQDELLPLIATLPVEQRLLVSHHFSLGYFAGAYGFAELGTVVPGLSGLAEPGVAELAAIIDLVRERNLSAIFGEATSDDDDLMRQVSNETGAALVDLDLETLGEEGSPIGTWIGLMRSNTEAIVGALSGEMSG